MFKRIENWVSSGAPWVWLSAGAVSVSLLMVFGLLLLIALRGLGYFWPADIVQMEYQQNDNQTVLVAGEIKESEDVTLERLGDVTTEENKGNLVTRYLVKTGNRDVVGLDFRWLREDRILSKTEPENIIAIERREWGNFYGKIVGIIENGTTNVATDDMEAEIDARLERALEIHSDIKDIEKHEIGAINYQIEQLRLDERRLELKGDTSENSRLPLIEKRKALDKQYEVLFARLNELNSEIQRDTLVVETVTGQKVNVAFGKIVNIYYPNAMSVFEKSAYYLYKVWEFISDEPREANTEGGIFPAIFGTVLMVILMSVMVTPFGVIAALYLREYAKQGFITRTIRIAVNNLAGVPSIVYGVFGLGFFVYFLGGNLDALFYPEALPAPTFGTPGIMWSSLTLAILTLPVVIVATEEGLSRIPRAVREGSLALGATKAETLLKVVIPMSSPAIMTGLILAVARAAGEVAPLMLVGVVKLAPSLPLDGNFPFLHMERKFMHLGFHIYDVGFQSPNVEAARPLVYATALLLVVVIIVLNLAAIAIRNRLREKYRALEN